MRPSTSGPRGARRGFSLIELMVAVAIGMALVLAITLMLARSEDGRRSMASVNDNMLGGSYAAYLIDRVTRSAGSGYAQAWREGVGCRLQVSRSGTQLLPRSSDFPAPFASVPKTLYLAPVVVHAGAGTGGSDVLQVATGNSALGETPLRVLPASSGASGVRINATVGLRANDLVLVMQDGTQCMLQQVKSGFTGGADQALDFSGTYAATAINGVQLADLGDDLTAWVAPIGNVSGNQPQFVLFGIDADAKLSTYDLLRLDGTDTPLPIAEGVADLRALYGVDTNDDGKVDAWKSPDTSPFDAASLQSGSAEARLNLGRVLAVRVGLLMRSPTVEKDVVAPSSLTLFADMADTLQRTRTLSTTERHQRWRTFEFTVPLRNVMLSPRS